MNVYRVTMLTALAGVAGLSLAACSAGISTVTVAQSPTASTPPASATAATRAATTSAAASPGPASGIDPCVVGTWKGVSQIVPVVAGEPAQLTGPGPQHAVLRQDGTGSISYGSGVSFRATVMGQSLTEVVAGGGTFDYQTSGGLLLFSNAHGSGTQTLYVDGVKNVSTAATGSTSVRYVCSGNSLKLYSLTGTGSTELTRTSS
jgi:hypothetical protein